MNARRWERIILLLPAAVLVSAFAGICVLAGSAWPWNDVVHEDGRRTLLETVFYFEHATRELLPDFLLALAVAGAVRYYFPPVTGARRAVARRWRAGLGATTVATLAAIVGGTIWTEGAQAVVQNLAQLHTREGAPLAWGAHWRYHLLERLALMLFAFSVAGVIRRFRGGALPGGLGRVRGYGAALVLFATVTALFRLTDEPFRDPAFLGHQLRELLTHGLVTLPLALGVCLGLARRFSADTAPQRSPAPGIWPVVLTGAVSLAVGVFLLVAALAADAQSHGQATGLAALLFPHFAEHSLGYALVPALAGFLYLWPETVTQSSTT